ncbi:MAG: DUF86 domain-containing protein [Acidobacteriia bacterium]|nr:DUF86 domain-containing protein [Terriglobia bacterium]
MSRNFTEEHPEIPWRAIVGTTHKVVHDYLHVDEDVVWDVVTADLEPLAASLSKLLRD